MLAGVGFLDFEGFEFDEAAEDGGAVVLVLEMPPVGDGYEEASDDHDSDEDEGSFAELGGVAFSGFELGDV